MWKRNLLFWFVAVVAVAVALGRLFPQLPHERPDRAPVSPPADASVAAVVEQIDAAFEAEWNRLGQMPAGTADDLTAARRLSLALCGTIPSLEELRRFEALPAEARWETWLSERLADVRTAPYLAERLARALVGTDTGPFVVYRRRRFVSWLTDQLRRDRPYDAVVRDLIASDGLGTDQPATNFLNVAINFDAKPAPDETVLATRTARAFLGVRLDCAQCHDHPFAPWKQHDFAQLAAYFSHAKHTIVGLQDRPGDPRESMSMMADGPSATPRPPFQPELAPDWGDRRWQLAQWITHPENRAFARAAANRAWALVCGRALVEPLDDLPLTAEGCHPALVALADDFTAHGYRLSRLLRVIASTRAFRLASVPTDAAGEELPVAGEVDLESEDAASPTAYDWASFPLSPLRPEQLAAAVTQTSSLVTADARAMWLLRIMRWFGKDEFVTRFGDAGTDELVDRAPTVTQRLLLMNGKLAHEATNPNPVMASTRIAQLAPDNPAAVETAYLVCLTRRPTDEELAHFSAKLQGKTGPARERVVADLCWTLLNSVEFASNH